MLVAALLAFAVLFVALGVWQVKRLAWKEALIARVDAGLHAAPVGVEAIDRHLSPQSAKTMEYRRLTASGIWLGEATTLVAGSSELGTGYWVMTPLELSNARVIFVNRGFVPMGKTSAAVILATPSGPITVIGLLRPSETTGSFLRRNDPEAGHWFSRDIAALAVGTAPTAETGWFIDAQQANLPRGMDAPAGQPVPGLTVISFPNNHLSYAITWFVMAIASLGAILVVRRYRA